VPSYCISSFVLKLSWVELGSLDNLQPGV